MRLMFVGDINLGEYYTAFGHGPKTYCQKNNIFSGVSEVLKESDILFGNLEAPITNYRYDPQSVESSVLRADPQCIGQLSAAGFNVLQVANNHSMQHGLDGFLDTISILDKNKIHALGLQNQNLLKIQKSGISVGFYAASDVPDNTNKNQNSYQILNEDFLRRVKEQTTAVDHLFVLLHWGREDSTVPLDYQKSIISELTRTGVRGVIGHHPHLFYEVWHESENSIAAPSLGNFVFDLFWDDRLLRSGILDLDLDKHSLKNAKIWPVKICKKTGRPICSSKPIKVNKKTKIYNLGKSMKHQQIKKIYCFIKDYKTGDKKLKRQFIFKKTLGKIK